MSNSDTKWTSDGTTIPDIETHTKTKHLLTEQYVRDLIYILYGKSFPHGIKTFTFIDGFCGGGIYRDPDSSNLWDGSPIRLIKAVREGYEKSERTHPLNVKFIFIDQKKSHLECLKNHAMSNAGLEELVNGKEHIFKSEFGELTEQCEFICDDFENKINYCVFNSEHRKGHSLFFLDPFGWSDVSMESFRKINSLKKSEIIYTFMIHYIKRFPFVKNEKERETFKKVFESEGYFDLNYLKSLDTFGEQAFYRNELMKLLREKGLAKKIVTFSLFRKSDNNQVFYYLVHISSHLRATEVMKNGSWQYNNLDYQYHYDIFGFGFKTSNYYQENQGHLQFDISEDSETACINKLRNNLDRIIYDNEEIQFSELCDKTMELNPATIDHYYQCIKFLRSAGDIDILRKNKTTNQWKRTNSKEIKNNDIIRKSQQQKLFLLQDYIKE